MASVKKKWAVYLSVGVVVVFEEVSELLEDEDNDAIAAPEEEKDEHKNVVGVIAVVAELEEVVVVVVAVADIERDDQNKAKMGAIVEPWKIVGFENLLVVQHLVLHFFHLFLRWGLEWLNISGP